MSDASPGPFNSPPLGRPIPVLCLTEFKYFLELLHVPCFSPRPFRYLQVYENDGSLVSTHNLTSRTVTHAPIEEILEAPVNAKAEAPSTSSDSTYSTSGNNVYFVDGREGKLSFA